MADNVILNVEGLAKAYGTLEALKSISFTVKEGEIFGIMGPNGAGKSTALECILNTKKKDRGQGLHPWYESGKREEKGI